MEFLWECMMLSLQVALGGLCWVFIAIIITIIFGSLIATITRIKNKKEKE